VSSSLLRETSPCANPGVGYNHAWRKYIGAAGVAKSARAISQTINGLSFFDFQRIDWTAAKERWIAESRKAPASKEPNQSRARCFAKALKDLNPRVFHVTCT